MEQVLDLHSSAAERALSGRELRVYELSAEVVALAATSALNVTLWGLGAASSRGIRS